MDAKFMNIKIDLLSLVFEALILIYRTYNFMPSQTPLRKHTDVQFMPGLFL